MNLGLGNLSTLKTQLLAEAVRASTKYDALLQSIGSGVAGQLQKHCNRLFARVENDTFICRADRDHVYLPRYPLEDLTAVELKLDQTTGWEVQSDFVINRNDASGQVYWGGSVGPAYAQLRFTFTGGYWFDATEENNDTLPAGATALPADLQLAWILQCRAVWQAIDKTGVELIKTGTAAAAGSSIGGLALSDQVKEMISGYRRYQIA